MWFFQCVFWNINYKIFDKKILIIKNNIATKVKKTKFRQKRIVHAEIWELKNDAIKIITYIYISNNVYHSYMKSAEN